MRRPPSLARTLLAGLAVALAAGTTVLAGRLGRRPYAPEAPEYRRLGPAGAPVTIVVFSDLQCPACRFAVEPLHKIETLYDGKVRVIFKHFPLRMHAKAKDAAVAAECAGRQGRFWAYHDKLYATQLEWSKEQGEPFETYARALGLDAASFSACLKDPAAAALVERDMQDGEDHWVVSTPTFFINGRRFAGARQLTDLGVAWIDKLLREGS